MEEEKCNFGLRISVNTTNLLTKVNKQNIETKCDDKN